MQTVAIELAMIVNSMLRAEIGKKRLKKSSQLNGMSMLFGYPQSMWPQEF